MAKLRRGHLRLPSDGAFLHGRSYTVVVTVVKPKTRFRAARLQAVVVHEAAVMTVAEAVVAARADALATQAAEVEAAMAAAGTHHPIHPSNLVRLHPNFIQT